VSALEWSSSQLVARLLILVGPVVGIVAAAAAGAPSTGWAIALVLVLSFGWAFYPESSFGTMSLVVVLVWWGRADLEELPAEMLVAAFAVLVAHLAALLCGYGPPEMAIDGPTVRLWVNRGAAVFATAPVVWMLAALLRDQPEPPGVWIAGMVAIVVAALVAAVAFGVPEEEPVGEA
jgi:hypothetical protein